MEAVGSRFAGRYKTAGLDVQAVRVKQARRRSLSQKENRERVVRQSRRFLPPPGPGPPLEEEEEGAGPESSKAKTSVDSRREMLRRYKEDKLLRQLKAQRENPKPVFRAGVYRPDAAQYLELRTVPQTTEQSKPKTFLPSSLRVTRSMSKKLESMLPNETRHAVSTKVDSVVAHVKSNQGGYTRGLAVTQAQCQLPPPAAGAKERKAPHAAPLKPPQTRGRTEPKPALKVAGPVPASINPPQTRGRTGLKPILKSAASVQVSEPRISVGKTLKQAEKEEKHYRKQAAHILPAQPEPEILPEPDSAEEMAGGAEEMAGGAEEMALQAGDGRQILSSATVLAPGEVDKKVSFAPENYAFRPMTGLAPFIFTPLSPRQAASFWEPVPGAPSDTNILGGIEFVLQQCAQLLKVNQH
eukprot:gi/632983112/ref/XP_007908485.1/ PREDICTED: disks large-associated protein 5 isoform X2 [Callorhinchus milii]